MIETAAIVLISVILGYLFGSRTNPKTVIKDNIQTITKEVMKEAEKQVATEQPSGAIKRPSAQALYEKNRPEKEREGLEAMKEAMDKVPDLVAAKEQAERMKAAGTWIPFE